MIKHTELAWDKENHRLFRLEGRKRGKVLKMQNDLVADSGRGRRAGRQRQILSCIQPSGSGRNLSPANQREPTDLETPCSGESKEVIGGYWFILANDLDEAAQIAKGNPCLDCGLFFEIRPIDPQRATPDNTRQS